MIPKEIINAILPILKQYKVLHAPIFGSFARGTQNADSDLDLLVELPKGTSLLTLGGLYMDIKDSIGRRVHILTTNTKVDPIIQKNIQRDLTPIL
jgi:predicted nucleotidyltransferase